MQKTFWLLILSILFISTAFSQKKSDPTSGDIQLAKKNKKTIPR